MGRVRGLARWLWRAYCQVFDAVLIFGTKLGGWGCVLIGVLLFAMQVNGWLRYGEWISLPVGYVVVKPEVQWLADGADDATQEKRRTAAAQNLIRYVPSLPRTQTTVEFAWWLYEPQSWVGVQRVVLWLTTLPMTIFFIGVGLALLTMKLPESGVQNLPNPKANEVEAGNR